MLAAALLVACGPAEEIGPDAGDVDAASLDNASVEGDWTVKMTVVGCGESDLIWLVPSFDVEVESDGDVVALCPDCTAITASVPTLDSMIVTLTHNYNNYPATVTINATDDGSTAHASARLYVPTANTVCDATDPDADITRRRE